MILRAAAAPQQVATAGGGGPPHARHVAIIMDGNGRWAKKRHLPRAIGHKRGVEAVREVVRAARTMGLEALTLYAFSTENWRRPEDEISALMGLLKHFIVSDLDEFAENNVRLKIIGDYKAFAPDIVEMVENALARTAGNDGTTLVVALNYGYKPRSPRLLQRRRPRVRLRQRASKPNSTPPASPRSTC